MQQQQNIFPSVFCFLYVIKTIHEAVNKVHVLNSLVSIQIESEYNFYDTSHLGALVFEKRLRLGALVFEKKPSFLTIPN